MRLSQVGKEIANLRVGQAIDETLRRRWLYWCSTERGVCYNLGRFATWRPGLLADDLGTYGAGTWIRNPDGFRRVLSSVSGATFWAKRGHLPLPRLGESAP